MTCAIEARVEPRLYVGPGTLVLVFLLSPDKISIRVLCYFCFEKVVWERRDLMNHTHIFNTMSPKLLGNIKVKNIQNKYK